jgi:hypothetical protein
MPCLPFFANVNKKLRNHPHFQIKDSTILHASDVHCTFTTPSKVGTEYSVIVTPDTIVLVLARNSQAESKSHDRIVIPLNAVSKVDNRMCSVTLLFDGAKAPGMSWSTGNPIMVTAAGLKFNFFNANLRAKEGFFQAISAARGVEVEGYTTLENFEVKVKSILDASGLDPQSKGSLQELLFQTAKHNSNLGKLATGLKMLVGGILSGSFMLYLDFLLIFESVRRIRTH